MQNLLLCLRLFHVLGKSIIPKKSPNPQSTSLTSSFFLYSTNIFPYKVTSYNSTTHNAASTTKEIKLDATRNTKKLASKSDITQQDKTGQNMLKETSEKIYSEFYSKTSTLRNLPTTVVIDARTTTQSRTTKDKSQVLPTYEHSTTNYVYGVLGKNNRILSLL